MQMARRSCRGGLAHGDGKGVSPPEKTADAECLPLVLLGASLILAAALSRSARPQLELFLVLSSVVALLGAVRVLALGRKRIVLGMSSRRLLAFLLLVFLADVATLGTLGPARAFLLGAFANVTLLAALLGAFYLHLRVRVWQPFVAAAAGVAATLLLCSWVLGAWDLSTQAAGGALWADGNDIAALWSALTRTAAHGGVRAGVLLGLLTYAALPWAAFVCAGILFVFFFPTRTSMPAGLFCAACLTFALQRMTYLNLWLLQGSRLPLAGFCELSRPAGFLLVALPQCLFVIAIVSAIHAQETAQAPIMPDVPLTAEPERERLLFEALSRRLLVQVQLAAGGVARRALARELGATDGESQSGDAPVAALGEKLTRLRESCAEVLGKEGADEALRKAYAAFPRELRSHWEQAMGSQAQGDLERRPA